MYDEGGVFMPFHEQKCIDEQSLLELYGSVGWTAYTTDSKQLMKAVEQSLKVITVWQEKELIGLIRSVGDGETILYIQDLLVHPTYQKQGIGTALMKKMVEAYPNVRQKVLLAENDPVIKRFYEKNGFHLAEQQGAVCFYKEY